jgi:hypothetical protein
MSATRPPLEYLGTCSVAGLESFELARMNRAANLRKELLGIVEEWIEAEVDARVARLLLESQRLPPLQENPLAMVFARTAAFQQMTLSLPRLASDPTSAVPLDVARAHPADPNDSRVALQRDCASPGCGSRGLGKAKRAHAGRERISARSASARLRIGTASRFVKPCAETKENSLRTPERFARSHPAKPVRCSVCDIADKKQLPRARPMPRRNLLLAHAAFRSKAV